MIAQENIPPDFRDWIAEVQTALESRLIEDLPKKRLEKLATVMLKRLTVKTVAQEMVNGLPDALLEELADAPVDSLVYGLAHRLNNHLLYILAQTVANWLEERLLASAGNGSVSLHNPVRHPVEMARWLTWKLADESKDGLFYFPEETTPARPDELAHLIYRIAGVATTIIFTRYHKPKLTKAGNSQGVA